MTGCVVNESLGGGAGGGDFGGECLGELIFPNGEVSRLVEAIETGAVADDLVGDMVIAVLRRVATSILDFIATMRGAVSAMRDAIVWRRDVIVFGPFMIELACLLERVVGLLSQFVLLRTAAEDCRSPTSPLAVAAPSR